MTAKTIQIRPLSCPQLILNMTICHSTSNLQLLTAVVSLKWYHSCILQNILSSPNLCFAFDKLQKRIKK